MLIGIISDIHGNRAALVRVLAEARQAGVEQLLVLGDFIGYYYSAVDVFDLLKDWKKQVVRGNHEDMFEDVIAGRKELTSVRKKYGSGLEIAINTLSMTVREEIQQMKRTQRIEIGGQRILIGHGTPWSTDDYVYPDASLSLLQRCEVSDLDVVFLGHTHYPFVYRGKQTMVINPGSVGQSRVTGGVAEWGILNSENGVYVQKRTRYDTQPLKKEIERNDPDIHYLKDILDRNAL
jgi:putative phosphoesterase